MDPLPPSRPAPAGEEQLVKELSVPLFASKGWMRFLGVLCILYGVMTALSIIGILVAWIPIWAGILLMKAAGDIEMAQLGGDKGRFLSGTNQLRTLFMLTGILMIIQLVLIVISFLVWGGAMLAYISEMGG